MPTGVMFETVQNKIADRLRRSRAIRAAARFARREDGATAIEFGFVALPFLALTFAILQTALIFFATQELEAAVATAARLVMTGQAQTAGYSQADFKNQVCTQLNAMSLFNCSSGVYVDVKSYSTFAQVNTAQPITNNQLDTSNFTYSPGGPGDIVVVSLYYQWPVYVSLLGDNLGNLGSTQRLLVATSAFRNEPYN
jgi:Flp pilus assembly protein TadG